MRSLWQPDQISLIPLTFWMIAQLAALAIAAFRVPLAAQYPQPAEFQAVRVLLAVQFAIPSLIFPLLLRTIPMSLIAGLSAGVMLVFSAALAGWNVARVLPDIGFMLLWLTALSLAAGVFRGRQAGVGSAIAGIWVIGGPMLCYLRLDFGTGLPVEAPIAYGPIWAACAAPPILSANAWWGVVGIALAMLLAHGFSFAVIGKSNRLHA